MVLIDKLNGKKTIIVGILISILAVLEYLGYIGSDQAEVLYGLLGGTGLVALRLGVDKAISKKVK